MPQVRKDEVDRRLREAARAAFAELGYAGAGVAEIARRAGVSPGNVYRYFPDKEALFAAVVPASLVERIDAALEDWLAAAGGLEDLRLTAAGGYARRSRPLVELVLAHRLEAVILLGQGAGTPYAGFGEAVAQRLVAAALRLAAARPGAAALPNARRFALEEICRSYVWAVVRILETFADPAELRAALADYEHFHLAGLRAFFA